MSEFICKIANLDELIKKWDYEISIHPSDENWIIWKNKSIEGYKDNNQLCYIGVLDGEIITEATAMLSTDGIQNSDGLVNADTVYLCAFRTRKEYQGQGYFSKLYRYMENDLYNKGYRVLTLGVVPDDVKNKEIYFKYGFTHFVKSSSETYPDGESVLVEYYLKQLEDFPFEYKYSIDKNRAAEIRAYFKDNAGLDLDLIAASRNTTWEKTLQLSKFVADNIPHNNQTEPLGDLNAISLWEYAKRVPSGFNCRWHSILLCELLLSVGIKNRFVTCMPEDENDNDCHVVNLVWLPENEKWAMIDSDMMEYVIGENGVPLSLEEMQNELNAGRELNIIMDTDAEGIKSMQSYWAKNLHHFATHTKHAFDLEGQYGVSTSYICLVPMNYNCPHKEIYDAITTNAVEFWDR